MKATCKNCGKEVKTTTDKKNRIMFCSTECALTEFDSDAWIKSKDVKSDEDEFCDTPA